MYICVIRFANGGKISKNACKISVLLFLKFYTAKEKCFHVHCKSFDKKFLKIKNCENTIICTRVESDFGNVLTNRGYKKNNPKPNKSDIGKIRM